MALVEWEGSNTTTQVFGIDRRTSVTVHFHRRRLDGRPRFICS